MSTLKTLSAMAIHRQQSEVFAAFVKLSACAASAGLREAEYTTEAKRWTKEELTSFSQAFGELAQEMEARPYTDLLGEMYMETLGESGRKRGGEFHTPKTLCDLMAGNLSDNLPKGRPITVAEPACGAGAMILSFAAQLKPADISRLRVTATDINRVACDMCSINTTLWNIPTIVIHGDTLSGKTWGRWANFPMVMAAPVSSRADAQILLFPQGRVA